MSAEEVNRIRDAVRSLKTEIDGMTMNYHQLREMEMIANRFLTILERMTGSKEVAQAINMIQRFITMIRMAQATYLAFEAATGPIGWLFALSGAAMTAVTAGSFAMEMK